MLIARGEVAPSDGLLDGTWSWVEVVDHEKLYRTLVDEVFTHHVSMVHGDQVTALLGACTFLNSNRFSLSESRQAGGSLRIVGVGLARATCWSAASRWH